MNNNTQFELSVFPPFYSELNKPLPEAFPKPNIGCGIRTNLASGLIFPCIVSPEEAMIYNDVQGLINELHEGMDENTGIIEVNAGTTKRNNYKYIYAVRKMNAGSSDIPEIHYALNMNVRIGDKDYFINGDYMEEGTTGVRDSTVYAYLYSRGIINNMNAWIKDPYDENYERGLRMNISERREFDEMFPNHPLSELRKYVEWIIENN